jgi:DNA-binding XRE family transcriptional regulator
MEKSDHPLKVFRKAKGLSQTDVARAVGLKSPSAISEIEAGQSCTVQTALALELLTGGKIEAASLCPDVLLVEKARGLRKRAPKAAAKREAA